MSDRHSQISTVPQGQDEPRLYTLDEVARILRVGRSTVYDHMMSGDIPYIRIGRKIRMSQYQLDRYLHGEEGEGKQT